MSESDSDDPAVRPADIGQLTRELEVIITQLSHPQEEVQSVCPLGTGIEVDTVNGSSDGRAMATDTTEEAKEPSDEPNQNVVDEVMNGRKSKLCVDGIDARTHNESDENNSKNELDLNSESRNSEDTDLNMNSENSKRCKLPARDDEFDGRDFLMISSDEEDAEKPTMRREAKVSKAKKPTTASSSRAKSVELALTDESEDTEATEQICIDDSDDLTICDDAAARRSRNNRPKRNDSAEVRSSVYPRRVVPPFSGGEYAGRRPRKPVIETRRKKKKTKLEDLKDESRNSNDTNLNINSENSKRRKLPVRDDEFDRRDFLVTSSAEEGAKKSARRREAKVSNAKKAMTASSSKAKCVELVLIAESKDNLAEAKPIRQEERRIRDEAATRRKVERVKQRLQEEAKKSKLEERNEKLRLSFEQTWRENMWTRQKVPSVKVVPENHSGMQRNVEMLSNDWRGNLSQTDRVLCPICSKDFSIVEIEVHAAHCEQYEPGNSAEGSRSNSPVALASLETPKQRDMLSTPLTYDTCSTFTARNERELEDHVAFCLPRQGDDVDDGNGSVVMASNSPAVPMFFGMPKQRDILSNMSGQAGLPDDEVAQELENDEETILQSSLADSSRIISSGPLSPSSMERGRRIEIKFINLEKQRVRNEEKTQRKAERVEQRVQEEAEKAKLEEQKEKRRLINEQTWRQKMREKEKQRQTARIESSPEGPREGRDVPSTEAVPENPSEPQQRDVEKRIDDRRRNLSKTEQFPCPICSINFPAAEIEHHASRCVEHAQASSASCSTLNTPVVPMSRPPKRRALSSTLLECYICSKFTARNGWEFEDHVTSCLARQREREREAA